MDIEKTLKAANAIFAAVNADVARDISGLLTEAVDEVKSLQSQITELQGEKERLKHDVERHINNLAVSEKANTNLQQQVDAAILIIADYIETTVDYVMSEKRARKQAMGMINEALQADQEKEKE